MAIVFLFSHIFSGYSSPTPLHSALLALGEYEEVIEHNLTHANCCLCFLAACFAVVLPASNLITRGGQQYLSSHENRKCFSYAQTKDAKLHMHWVQDTQIHNQNESWAAEQQW